MVGLFIWMLFVIFKNIFCCLSVKLLCFLSIVSSMFKCFKLKLVVECWGVLYMVVLIRVCVLMSMGCIFFIVVEIVLFDNFLFFCDSNNLEGLDI